MTTATAVMAWRNICGTSVIELGGRITQSAGTDEVTKRMEWEPVPLQLPAEPKETYVKRFASLILTALIASPLIAGLPLTQATAQEPPAAAEPATEPVPFSEEPSLLYATELMQRAELYAQSIADLSDVPEVEVREVTTLPRTDASPAVFVDTINRFMTYYSDDIATLRAAMEGNPVVAEALEAAGVEISDIVAAEIRPDLALRVYIRDW